MKIFLATALLQLARPRGPAAAALLAIVGCAALPDATATSDPPDVPAYRFERVADGVYCAIGTGARSVGCNSCIIVTSEGTVVVDSGTSPAAARALLAGLRTLTAQPVRYLINTHFHYDHTFGNEAFPAETVVVGHEFTRAVMTRDPLHERSFLEFSSGLQNRMQLLPAQIDAQPDATKRQQLQVRLSALEQDHRDTLAAVPRAPTLTFRDRLALRLGDREIQLLFLGRGHTAGDIVVFLPQERILCAGDLFNGYVGYLGDAFVDDWAGTLDELAKLDFATIIPGHGQPFSDRTKLPLVQDCLRELWREAAAGEAKGLTAAETARQIDLRRHAKSFPQFRQVGVPPLAVTRIFEVIAQRRRDPARPTPPAPLPPGAPAGPTDVRKDPIPSLP